MDNWIKETLSRLRNLNRMYDYGFIHATGVTLLGSAAGPDLFGPLRSGIAGALYRERMDMFLSHLESGSGYYGGLGSGSGLDTGLRHLWWLLCCECEGLALARETVQACISPSQDCLVVRGGLVRFVRTRGGVHLPEIVDDILRLDAALRSCFGGLTAFWEALDSLGVEFIFQGGQEVTVGGLVFVLSFDCGVLRSVEVRSASGFHDAYGYYTLLPFFLDWECSYGRVVQDVIADWASGVGVPATVIQNVAYSRQALGRKRRDVVKALGLRYGIDLLNPLFLGQK